MREDDLGKQILQNPRTYVTDRKEILIAALKKQWELITPDINIDIEEYTENHNNYFDYTNLYKNSQFVKDMSRRIIAEYTRMARRNENNSFGKLYEEISAQHVPQPN